ncbi:MAG: alpha/beta hydrolase [Alphaproteobacteria bacterium]
MPVTSMCRGSGAIPRLALALALTLASGAVAAETLTAATGYTTEYDVYAAAGPVAVIFLHGKNSTQATPLMRQFAERVAQAGFTVYLPLMPWSRKWDGTVADANAVIDALVAIAARDGRRVVVGGQSLGATFAITWRSDDAPDAVVGKLFTNPGGMLDMIPPSGNFWKAIGPALAQARALEAAGKGRETATFVGTNVIGTQSIEERYETTPEIFLSFHDRDRFPSVRAALAKTRGPVLWATGKADPIPMSKRRSFDMMPAHAASLYIEPDGDHNSSVAAALDAIVDWLGRR